MKQNIYKLTDGMKPVSWQVPLKNLTLEKFVEQYNEELEKKETVSVGKRRVKYVPGTNSIFEEDLKGDYTPVSLWFEFGELRCDKDDALVNKIMQEHPMFNKRWTLWSKEGESKKELEELRAKDKVRELINDTGSDNLKAVAYALFGAISSTWDDATAELEVRKYADKKPIEFQKELSSKSFESKRLAGLALSKGILAINSTKTAIVWNDTTKGEVLVVAKGEKPFNKLVEFLATRSDESELVLQTIQERIDKLSVNIPKKEDDVAKTIKDKDAEIEDLKKQLAEAQKGGGSTSTDGLDDSELTNLQEEYKKTFEGKEVPPRYRNDKEWIAKKIAEAKK